MYDLMQPQERAPAMQTKATQQIEAAKPGFLSKWLSGNGNQGFERFHFPRN
jgi:hypothetical protein